jgi:hypothetical protein
MANPVENATRSRDLLIRKDIAKRQLDDIPVLKYPFFNDFLDNKELHEEIASLASDRIEKNLEDIIVSCGDLFFHLLGKKDEKNIDFSYARLEIERLCRGERPSFIHFHGPYLGFQSELDAEANVHFFSDGANMGCATGIDGIHCRLRTHMIRVPWNDKFYDKLKQDRGYYTYKDVKSISCSKFEKKGNGKKIRWMCTVNFKDGKGNYSNVFDEVNFEHSSKAHDTNPYTMLEDKEGEYNPPYKIVYSKYYNEEFDDSDDVSCAVVSARNNEKRILTCFKST